MPYFRQAFRKLNPLQTGAVVKGRFTDLRYSLRKNYACNQRVALEQAGGNFRHAFRNVDFAGGRRQHGNKLRPIRVIDDSIQNFYASAALVHKAGQTAAVVKNVFSQRLQGSRQRNGGQVITTVERLVPDFRHAVGDRDVAAGACVFRQHAVGDLEAIIRTLGGGRGAQQRQHCGA